jgi:Fe-S cluster biogenesis protein NfuA
MTIVVKSDESLEELVQEISRFEAIIADWDESQRGVVIGLKQAIDSLHKVALTRLIKSIKTESMPALQNAVQDEIVYGVLLYHKLVKAPNVLLLDRIKTAIEAVRPSLKNHHGDIELIAVKIPDIVEIKLLGTCNNCPTVKITLSETIETTIKAYCPEIRKVILLK